MPELPEVETVKRGLSDCLVGKQIESIDFDWPKSFPNSENEINEFIISAKITSVRRRAKMLIMELSSDYSLVVHLKMTGQLVYRGEGSFGGGHPTNSLVDNLPDKSTRVEFSFTDKSKLFFNDQRKFGWVKLLPSVTVNDQDFFSRIGPEPLDKNLTSKDFIKVVRRRENSMIKPVILDQSVIAGIGNIYADESLYASRIHPETKVADLTDKQLSNLFDNIRQVLELGVAKGGSTDKNYVDALGNKGSYLEFAKVFRREGQPCENCGNEISKIKVGGRGTHICKQCQAK